MAPTGVAQTQTLHRRGKKTPTKESAPEVEEVEEVEEINPEAGNRPLSSSPPRKCPAHGMAKGFLSGTEGIFGPEASIFGPSRSALKNGQEQGGRCPMRSLGEAKGILGKLKWGLWNCWVTMTNPLDELDPTPVRLPEGMTMEEAMKKCPHLAEKVKAAQAAEAKGNQGGKVGSSGRCPHSEGGGDKGSRAKGEEDKVGGSGQCPHSKEAGDNGAQVKGRDGARGRATGAPTRIRRHMSGRCEP
ncbi:unnamed protein product [Ostreobium quekettii]|uniref:Uncharacterized protein n=1 Tax=Ostreobium quekettii TaxID=121088 RepID=A0A8S1INJ3_9CHLO|nr:unnamed protein product [Ostreobium quekettii]